LAQKGLRHLSTEAVDNSVDRILHNHMRLVVVGIFRLLLKL